VVSGTVTLASGAKTVTLSGSAAFTSGTSYACTTLDNTPGANKTAVVTTTSGTSITISNAGGGSNSDTIMFICVGN
jgi:hypothetical protein